jgi:hypothetical protein
MPDCTLKLFTTCISLTQLSFRRESHMALILLKGVCERDGERAPFGESSSLH